MTLPSAPSFVLRRLRPAALAVLAAGLLAPGFCTPAQAQGCLSAAQTRALIASGDIVQLSAIAQAAQAAGFSQIGSASVCGAPGNYVYALVASTSTGSSARLTFDARSGALLSRQ